MFSPVPFLGIGIAVPVKAARGRGPPVSGQRNVRKRGTIIGIGMPANQRRIPPRMGDSVVFIAFRFYRRDSSQPTAAPINPAVITLRRGSR